MKKVLKWLGASIAVVLVLGIGGLVTKFYLLSPKMRAAPDVKAPSSPEVIEKGKYLANHVFVCTGCHSEVQENLPGEPIVPETLGRGRDFGDHPDVFPGRIRARNLTPDPDTGLGKWTDGEILRAMREGVSRDGRVLFPMMPYRTYGAAMGDDEALAVIAYLRSLPPVKHDPGLTSVNFPVSMFIRAVPAPVTTPAPAAPDVTKDPLARGRWLLKVCSCGDCHDTAKLPSMEKIPGKELAGGMPFKIPGKGTFYSANITSDKATGIGAYSDEDILRVFNEGKRKDGRDIYGMPWPAYKGLSDDDKKALVMALRQVPAVANAVPAAELAK